MAEATGMKFSMEYNPRTDVMFIDLSPVGRDEEVEVIDVGEELGFVGQVQVRVGRTKQVLYGITIQNYRGFRRRLLWHYRMWSTRRALELLMTSVRAGLGADDRQQHPAMLY